MMLRNHKKWMLVGLSGGFLLQSSCSIFDAVVSTIGLAFNIVDIWV